MNLPTADLVVTFRREYDKYLEREKRARLH